MRLTDEEISLLIETIRIAIWADVYSEPRLKIIREIKERMIWEVGE